MPKIKFKLFTKVNDPILAREGKIPKNSVTIKMPKNSIIISLLFTIPLLILMFILYYIKQDIMIDFSMKINYVVLGTILGILCCFIHELLHAIVMPKNADVYIGFIPKKFMFYMKYKEPISKKRFILMSLIPLLLGIIPLIIFIISNNEILNSIMWPMAMIGLVAPASDYLNVYLVLKKVPNGSYIKEVEDGLCYFAR